MSRQRRLSPKEKRLLKRKQKGTLDTKFSMRNISPMTTTQEDMFDSYNADIISLLSEQQAQEKQCVDYILV